MCGTFGTCWDRSLCVGAGYGSVWRGAFWTLLKRWQAQYLVNSRLWIQRVHFLWPVQYFVDLDIKVAETWVKHRFSYFHSFSILILCGTRNVEWESNMCSRNLLGTLCGSDRSRCDAVRILISLEQPARHFLRVGSLLLWSCAIFFDMACATFSALCAWPRSRRGPKDLLGYFNRILINFARTSERISSGSSQHLHDLAQVSWEDLFFCGDPFWNTPQEVRALRSWRCFALVLVWEFFWDVHRKFLHEDLPRSSI